MNSTPDHATASPHTVPRRTILGAGLAATVVAAGTSFAPTATAQTAGSSAAGSSVTSSGERGIYPQDLEVITVTPTSITFGWVTYQRPIFPYFENPALAVPADTVLRIGLADSTADLVEVFSDPTPVAYHQVTVQGLEPGRTYRFEALSGGRTAKASIPTTATDPAVTSGKVTTLVPPPGRHIMRLAMLNDTHVGLGAHLHPADGVPYATRLTQQAVTAAKAAGCERMMINGDLTAEARPYELAPARSIFDTFGQEKVDWLAVRGNHDRPRAVEEDPNAGYDSAPILNNPDTDAANSETTYYDTVSQHFNLPYHEAYQQTYKGLRLLAMDSSEAGNSASGLLGSQQLDQVREMLAEDPDRPTLSFCHHPVSGLQALTALGGRFFIMKNPDATELMKLLNNAPGVFLHAGGHTHRARRSGSILAPKVDFVEFGATGEHPCGWNQLDIYEGGYMNSFHRVNSSFMHERIIPERWSSQGFVADYTLGHTDQRNFVSEHDLSGLG